MKSRTTQKSKAGTSQPRPFQSTFLVSKVIRFQASAAQTANVTLRDLGDLWCTATAANAAYQNANAFRVKAVEIWGPPASTLVPVTVSIEFSGLSAGSTGPSREISDTSVGASRVAHIYARPPRDSMASLWQPTNTTAELFSITIPTNAIVDLHITYVVRDDGSALAVGSAVAGATTGANYIRVLNSNSGGTTLTPVSYSTV